MIFQVTITASAASDIEVSTDRFVLSTETVSKRSTIMKNAQPHLPNVSTSESATAVGDISFEAQIIKDVLNEVIDNVNCP